MTIDSFRNVKSKIWILVVILTPLIFFFTPKVEQNQCIKEVKYKSHVLYIQNCDNHSVITSAIDYENFLTSWENNPWRGRPLHIAVGTILAPLVSPVAILLNKFNEKLTIHNKKKFLKKYSFYLSYTLFNYVCIFVICLVVFNFLGSGLSSHEKTLIALILSSVDIIQGWFWQSHSIFFNFVIPIISIKSFFIGYFFKLYEKKQIFLRIILIGSGVLFYQMAIIWLPMFLIGYIFANLNQEKKEILKNILFFSILLCIPFVLWKCINKLVGFSYSHELEVYTGFYWFKDALINNNLIEVKNKFLRLIFQTFPRSFGTQWIIPISSIVVFLGFNFLNKNNNFIKKPFVFGCSLAVILQLVFIFIFSGSEFIRWVNPLLLIPTILSIWFFKNYNREKMLYVLYILATNQLVHAMINVPITNYS